MKTKIKYVSSENIKLIVAETRSKYMQRYGSALPFNAEAFLESEYGMSIVPVPGLRNLGADCAFSRDGKTILVDKHSYDNSANSNRLCFTFAHELAHKILHEKYLPVIDDIDDENIGWAETQAGMFAAEFLMPEHLVLGVIATEILDRIEGIVDNDVTIEACVNYKLSEIASYFGVSETAMQNRMKNIDLASVLSGPYVSSGDVDTLRSISSMVTLASDSRQYLVNVD